MRSSISLSEEGGCSSVTASSQSDQHGLLRSRKSRGQQINPTNHPLVEGKFPPPDRPSHFRRERSVPNGNFERGSPHHHSTDGLLSKMKRRFLRAPRSLRLERKTQSSAYALRFCRRHFRSAAVTALLLLVQIVYNPLSWRRIDHFLTFRVMARRFPKVDQALREAGVVLPATKIDFANAINTHAALRELLVRRAKRARRDRNLQRVVI